MYHWKWMEDGIGLQVQNGSSNVNVEKRKEEPDNSAYCIDEHSFQVRSVTKTVLLRIIPVKIIGIKKSVETFALFDEGSTVTLIDANLAEDIGVKDIRGAKPLLLIGQNHIDLTIAREVIQGPSNAPVISKSKLGWVVHGNVVEFKYRVDQEFSMFVSSETKSDEDEELKKLIEQAIFIDNLGIEKENKKLLTEEDQKGLQIIENYL
ncbi:hypothetical protein JTB14_012608 [Gonioctena quinquepunctata]|nr:hypothetical protein JTB14_012608 [Gonioctena quinquepunctata]